MKESRTPEETAVPRDIHCLVQTVAEAMADEPALEAVKVNREQHTLSVATLGKPRHDDIQAFLGEQIEQSRRREGEPHCTLLDSAEACDTCAMQTAPRLNDRILVSHDGPTTTIERVTCPTAPKFWRWRDFAVPRIVPREVELPEDEEGHENEWKYQLAAAAMCGVFGLAAAFLPLPHAAAVALYALSYLAGAWFPAVEVWERLQHRTLDVHFLMLAVAAGSAAIGGWAEGATLLFLFSLSGGLEHYAMGRTHREIRSLFKTAPKTATVIDDAGHERVMPVAQLQTGARLLVKPGELFPVDAEVVKGATAADESNLTGEAAPVEKQVGDSVLSGTLNLWGGVEAVVLRPASQSALQKIITLIREAQRHKAPAQRFTDKFSTGYTYGILALTLVMFFVWWLGMRLPAFVSTATTRSAFYQAMTLLVVASPCALVLSIPSAVLAAIAWAARRGILFRGGAAVEKLAEVSVVAMDKTGTLTTGELQVERIESFPPGREREVAQLAYSIEKLSAHPLARAITRHGKHEGLAALPLERFESFTSHGLKASHQGRGIHVGRKAWIAAQVPDGALNAFPPTASGLSEVWLAGGDLVGRVVLRDDLRPLSGSVVAELRQLGLRTVVLTGDHKAAALELKQRLGPDEVRDELKPEHKVAAIQEFTRQGSRVAMIGDGVNDAPSLAAAHVGVAMGARGSDAALEQAEVVLMNDRLENFLTAYQLSQRARRVIRQNLLVSLGTVLVLVSFALLGQIPLTVGVIGHEGSTVVVVLNSLRLLIARPGGLKGSSPAA
jgi:Cd2+/Zn2+-exporting ATPase